MRDSNQNKPVGTLAIATFIAISTGIVRAVLGGKVAESVLTAIIPIAIGLLIFGASSTGKYFKYKRFATLFAQNLPSPRQSITVILYYTVMGLNDELALLRELFHGVGWIVQPQPVAARSGRGDGRGIEIRCSDLMIAKEIESAFRLSGVIFVSSGDEANQRDGMVLRVALMSRLATWMTTD